MIKMTNEQIDRINELLVTDAEALTAFYDEGLNIGAKNGAIGAMIGMAIGVSTVFICQKILSKCKKSKHEKEES